MRAFLASLCLTFIASLAMGQWTQLPNPTVSGDSINASTALLLTDGTVMVQNANATQWYRLTPDAFGNYATGTWSKMPYMTTPRLYYSSSVFADGRVIISGGEYRGSGTVVQDNTYEIFDPFAGPSGTWSSPLAVPGFTQIGDGPCTVLANGLYLQGSATSKRTLLYDPATDTWSTSPAFKFDFGSEESWVLMPDGTVVTANCQANPNAEKYLPWTNSWVSAGTVTPDIVEDASAEIGSIILLPDGRAFALGGNGNTSFYIAPADPNDPGTWVPGPVMPTTGGATPMQLGCKDTPGILFPNGNVLTAVGPVNGVGGDFLGPTSFLLWDAGSNSFSTVANPGGPFDAARPPYEGRMLLLPNGQVLYTQQRTAAWVYTPTPGFDNAWRPILDEYPTRVIPGRTYQLAGRQFNGMSQASGYGDDAWAPTNYPIVRLEYPSGEVFYARTHDHSSMGVATGNQRITTFVDIPNAAPNGDCTIVVVANGIPSVGSPLTVERFEPITSASLTGTLGTNGWYVGDVTVNLTYDVLVNGGVTTYHRLNGGPAVAGSSFVVNTDANPHSVEFWSVNGLFEESPHSFITFKRDATKPSLVFDALSPAANGFGWNNSSASIAYTASDNLSGVATALPGSPLLFTLEGAGQTKSVTVTDQAGNSKSFTTVAVNIDLTDPQTSDTQTGVEGCNGWFTGPVTVALAASDNLSGVQATRYRVDGGAVQTYSGSFVVSGDLAHSVEYWSVDNADNEETHHTITIKIDGTAPTITATPDKTTLWAPNHKMVPVTVTGSMTDNLSGVDPDTARFYVVDEYGLVQPAGAISLLPNGTYSFTILLEASRLGTDHDGRTYTVFVTCKDEACNETTVQFIVTVPHDQGGG